MDFLHLTGKKHPQIDMSTVVFSDYIIKINYRGKCQKRALIITPTSIHNCKPSGLRVKRTIPISDVENFTLSSISSNFILATKTGYDYNFNYKDPKALVDLISKQIHPKEFAIYFVDKTSLLEYTRTATKHKLINKKRKNINTTTSKSVSSGVVYKMPSSAQVKNIFKEKEALLLFFGLLEYSEINSKEINALEMWNKILQLKEKQNLISFDNFLMYLLSSNFEKESEKKEEFVKTFKNLLLRNKFISSTDSITKHLNDVIQYGYCKSNNNESTNSSNISNSDENEESNKLQIPAGLGSNSNNNESRKNSRTAAKLKIGGARPTIRVQGLNNFKLSIRPISNNKATKPNENTATINNSNENNNNDENKLNNNIKDLDINERPAIDLTMKFSPSSTKPSHTLHVKTNKNNTNNTNTSNIKKFRKLHLKEIADIALKDSIFLSTPKSELDNLSSLLINENLEPLFLVGYKDPFLTSASSKSKKDKTIKEKKNKTIREKKNKTIREKKDKNNDTYGTIKAPKFNSSPSILDAKTEQDLSIMFQMFRMLPFEILLNLMSYNKSFCTSENVEKLYISLSSISMEFKDAFIKAAQSKTSSTYLTIENAQSLCIRDNKSNDNNKDNKEHLKQINEMLVSLNLSKTENYLLLLFTERDIIFKLRLLLEAQNFVENYTQLNERFNNFIQISEKLKGTLNFDKVVLSFNILYNKLNGRTTNGYLIDELKDKFDFGTNNHRIKIVDYILSELSDDKLVSLELHKQPNEGKGDKSSVININALKDELEAAKKLISIDIGSALETVKEFNVIDEEKIQNNKCELFKNSLMEFMSENKKKLEDLKIMESKVNVFVKEFVVKFKGGRNYSERTGKNDFEMVIGMMVGMVQYVEKYVKKVNSI